jgi:hypothetical protein
LLLSICSATDSFQQVDYNSRKEHRTSASSLQTATATTSCITLAPPIGIFGGGAPAAATTTATDRRWKLYQPEQHEQSKRHQDQQRRKRQRRLSRAALTVNDEEYQKRKQEWAERYTTLDGLRTTFGSNTNKLYGDLDASTTRRLYRSLLPTAVCELVLDVEVRPEELAQLAFEARKAAKLYARERCHVPARLLANWYDGIRALKRYGRFQTEGMSYDQVFDKYYRRSALERSLSLHDNDDSDEWTEDDIKTSTYMKILESACRTNPLIDRMTLHKKRNHNNEKNNNGSEREDLKRIAQTLEDDVRKLLDPYNNNR